MNKLTKEVEKASYTDIVKFCNLLHYKLNKLVAELANHRPPFGVAVTPSIIFRDWQRLYCRVFLIYISWYYPHHRHVRSWSFDTLDQSLTHLQAVKLHLKQNKCAILCRKSVIWEIKLILAESVRPTEEKVRAIKEASTPSNASQLRSFLGLVNYCNNHHLKN